MKVGDRIDELGMLVAENGQLYFRCDVGGRLVLELRGVTPITAATHVRLIGTCIAPRSITVQDQA